MCMCVQATERRRPRHFAQNCIRRQFIRRSCCAAKTTHTPTVLIYIILCVFPLPTPWIGFIPFIINKNSVLLNTGVTRHHTKQTEKNIYCDVCFPLGVHFFASNIADFRAFYCCIRVLLGWINGIRFEYVDASTEEILLTIIFTARQNMIKRRQQHLER